MLDIKVKHWKEEQKILSLLTKNIPQTVKILSLRCNYTPQKCAVILHRLIERQKVKRIKLLGKYWYILNTY